MHEAHDKDWKHPNLHNHFLTWSSPWGLLQNQVKGLISTVCNMTHDSTTISTMKWITSQLGEKDQILTVFKLVLFLVRTKKRIIESLKAVKNSLEGTNDVSRLPTTKTIQIQTVLYWYRPALSAKCSGCPQWCLTFSKVCDMVQNSTTRSTMKFAQSKTSKLREKDKILSVFWS